MTQKELSLLTERTAVGTVFFILSPHTLPHQVTREMILNTGPGPHGAVPCTFSDLYRCMFLTMERIQQTESCASLFVPVCDESNKDIISFVHLSFRWFITTYGKVQTARGWPSCCDQNMVDAAVAADEYFFVRNVQNYK